MANEKNLLNEEVTGGAGNSTAEFRARKKEFDDAWMRLKMDSCGYSGMAMAKIYDDWELAGYSPDATTFLSSYKK